MLRRKREKEKEGEYVEKDPAQIIPEWLDEPNERSVEGAGVAR